MGGGAWSSNEFHKTIKTRGFSSVDAITNSAVNQSFTATYMDEKLNPYKVVRECVDTEEHPNTVPVMLCLDCTGSMGNSLKECFANLDKTITKLLENIADVEICVAGIGDFAYDRAPFQVSQYESDNRILDWLLSIWQEKGGGGNLWESYTAPWYFALHHTKLDCWKRGRKGIIITIGDEGANPYLPGRKINEFFGDNVQGDIDTKELLKEVEQKFDVYHIAITDDECSYDYHKEVIKKTWPPLLGQHFMTGKSKNLSELITNIVMDSVNSVSFEFVEVGSAHVDSDGNISW